MTNYMMTDSIAEIIPGLFLGDIFAAKNCAVMEKNNIKRVVNCAEELPRYCGEKYDYYHIPLKDDGSFEDILLFYQSIKPFLKFVDMRSLETDPVFIHCQMGVSRSCSMAVAYLLHKKTVSSLQDAYAYVIEKRKCAFEGGRYKVYDNALNDYFG